MIQKIMNFIKKLIGSLDTDSSVLSFSARKLTALFAILMGAYITKYHLPQADQLHALYAWLIIGLLCLGIVTVEQIIKFKTGQGTTNAEPK